jgi:hypothetical protein
MLNRASTRRGVGGRSAASTTGGSGLGRFVSIIVGAFALSLRRQLNSAGI